MRFARIIQIGFVLASGLFIYSFVASAQDGELRKACSSLCALAPNYVGDDRLAPEVAGADLDGSPRSLSGLRGRTVVLVFWTTSCAACKQQMQGLAELSTMFQSDSQSALLTVAVDEDAGQVRQILLEATGHPNPFPVLLDPQSEIVARRYGTRLFPETWVIDPEGIIRARFDGPRDWSAAVAVDLLRTVSRGDVCPLHVQNGVVTGSAAKLCEEAKL